MSLFSSIKRGLGFSADDDDDPLYADTTPATAETKVATQADAPSAQDCGPSLGAVEIDPEMQRRIFDRVVETFNAALPDFLQRTVDGKSQSAYLLETLDKSMREYLDNLAAKSQAYCEQQWQQRQTALSAELEGVRSRSAELEKQSNEIKQKQLSADRQKRALADRVHDLESQLGRLEAEREQFELENRSLVNRLKVATVQQDDIDSSRAEAERLKIEIDKMRNNPDENHVREIEALHTQIDTMTESLEALKEQKRVSDEMLADLRHRLAEGKEDLQSRDNAIAELTAKYDKTAAELAEANSLLDGFNEMADKMDEIDRLVETRDAKIKKQKETIAARDGEIESLRRTISENLRLQSEREKALQAEIEKLKAMTPATGAPVLESKGDNTAAEETAPRISDTELTNLEQTFESEDWFTKTPPADTPSMRPQDDDPDFGYTPPRRKAQPPHNNDQLSLF